MREIVDINGKSLKVGDRVAVAIGWTTNNAYLSLARVDEMKETKSMTKVVLTIEESGLWRYDHDHTYNVDKGRQITIGFPMSHCKIMIL